MLLLSWHFSVQETKEVLTGLKLLVKDILTGIGSGPEAWTEFLAYL